MYEQETITIAEQRADEIRDKFIEEVKRLLASGAVDRESHSRGLLFGVALENITDGFLRGNRDKEYRNLKRF